MVRFPVSSLVIPLELSYVDQATASLHDGDHSCLGRAVNRVDFPIADACIVGNRRGGLTRVSRSARCGDFI